MLSRTRYTFSLWLICPLLRLYSSESSPISFELQGFPLWLMRTQNFPIFVWVPGIVPSSHVGWFFSQPWLIASYVCTGQYLVKDLRTLCRSLELPFFETHSSWYSALWTLFSVVFLNPQPYFLKKGNLWALTRFPLQVFKYSVAWIHSQGSKLGAVTGFIWFVFSLSGIIILFYLMAHVWKLLSHVFCLVF